MKENHSVICMNIKNNEKYSINNEENGKSEQINNDNNKVFNNNDITENTKNKIIKCDNFHQVDDIILDEFKKDNIKLSNLTNFIKRYTSYYKTKNFKIKENHLKYLYKYKIKCFPSSLEYIYDIKYILDDNKKSVIHNHVIFLVKKM